VTFNLHGLVFGELIVTMLVLLVISGKRTMTRLRFQLRRHLNMSSGATSVLPVLKAARGVLGMNAWEEFVNDADFLRAHQISPAELESLKHASLMGSVTRKEDLLFILEAIRGRSSGTPRTLLAYHESNKPIAE
jgi:hypothetical protein